MRYQEKHNPYGGGYDHLNGKTAFGCVYSVDESLRRARVKTIGKVGVTDDMDLFNVQWISLSNHPQGDENSVLPRIGAYCVILFVNGDPYIVGYYRPLTDSTTTEIPNKPPLLPGDNALSTIAGNYLICRAGGSIEVQSTGVCRTLYLPSTNLINHICQNYELDADAGSELWSTNEQSGVCLWNKTFYDNTTPTQILDAYIGLVDATNPKVFVQITTGPTDEDGNQTSTLTNFELLSDGTFTFTIGPAASGITMTFSPKGMVELGNSSVGMFNSIYNTLLNLGKLQILTPLGPAAPINQAALWQPTIQLLLNQIVTLIGTVQAPS